MHTVKNRSNSIADQKTVKIFQRPYFINFSHDTVPLNNPGK